MLISSVILSFNSAKTLDRCLDDLAVALSGFDEKSEIIVVENGSMDESSETIRRYQDKCGDMIKPIFFDQNTGTTYSRNAAMRQASGDFILVLDSDAYVTKEALDVLIHYLNTHQQTGLAVPRLAYGSGNFQLSCDEFPTLVRKMQRFLFLKQMEDKPHPLQLASEPVDVDYAISACWLIRKDAFRKVGLFDEKIFYSPEDVDYCMRVWENGFKVTYVPDARVIHDAQELSRGFKLSKFHFSHLKGLFYLFYKHRYFWGLRRLYNRVNRYA